MSQNELKLTEVNLKYYITMRVDYIAYEGIILVYNFMGFLFII